MKTQKALQLATLVMAVALASGTGCKNEKANPEEHGADHAGYKHGGNATKTAGPSATGPSLSGAKCAAHDAPTEWCFICDASLREAGRLWCAEHARYEDRCWLCHPDLQDKKRQR